MTVKETTIRNELKHYIPLDDKLSQTDKKRLLDLDYNSLGEWAKTVYDYFYSHVDECGNAISINQFFDLTDCDHEYYKRVDKVFIDNLFAMQKPLFFFDVDNTLTDGGFLSEQKIDFIKNFSEKHRIILTTGKTYDSIRVVVDALELSGNYASCLNGSVLVDKGEFIPIEKIGSYSEDIVRYFDSAPFDTVVYYPDNIRLVKPLSERSLAHLTKYSEAYFEEEKLDFDKVVKVLFFIFDDEPDRARKEQMVIDYVQNYPELICMRTSENTYEILKKTQHKGNTVKIISKLLGNHYRATIGVGDSMNDSPLLSHVGKPYVVASASDELKSFGYDELEKNRDVDVVNLIKNYTKGEKDE